MPPNPFSKQIRDEKKSQQKPQMRGQVSREAPTAGERTPGEYRSVPLPSRGARPGSVLPGVSVVGSGSSAASAGPSASMTPLIAVEGFDVEHNRALTDDMGQPRDPGPTEFGPYAADDHDVLLRLFRVDW